MYITFCSNFCDQRQNDNCYIVNIGINSGLCKYYIWSNQNWRNDEKMSIETPGTLNIVENYTITSGTGRFANASGTFTVERVANQATAETSGTISGNLVIP